MAQLMRYHQYPVVGIGVSEHMIEVDGSWQAAYTRGGGAGEPYEWRQMPLAPDCSTSAAVYVKLDGDLVSEVETNSKGIYAFNCLESNTTYTIGAAAEGYAFSRHSVATGESRDYSSKAGNVWGVDLHACAFRGDFTADGSVDARDMSKLAQYWLQDAECLDVSPQPYGDGVVDFQDFAFMAAYWLGGGK